jgi:hypothetical protein
MNAERGMMNEESKTQIHRSLVIVHYPAFITPHSSFIIQANRKYLRTYREKNSSLNPGYPAARKYLTVSS